MLLGVIPAPAPHPLLDADSQSKGDFVLLVPTCRPGEDVALLMQLPQGVQVYPKAECTHSTVTPLAWSREMRRSSGLRACLEEWRGSG